MSEQQDATADVTTEWREGHLATDFSRWHPQLAALQRATSDHGIAAAGARPGDAVLDVGCGSGIPALAVAEVVAPGGRVMATDPSEVFVAAVAENAWAARLANVEVVRASATGLPFAPGSFDAATCAMGVMFSPDVRAGLARIREGLRPGGRAAFVAWGPDADNAFMTTFRGAARSHLPPDPPPAGARPVPAPDTPRPTRVAEPGSLSAALVVASFADVREEAPLVDLVWPGPPESLARIWLELTRVEGRVEPDRREAVRADVAAAYERFTEGGTLRMPVRVVVASGAA